MVIAVDNGNKQTKSRNAIFTSGFEVTSTKPGFGTGILEYNGMYYILSNKRKGYLRDKTQSEDCFILTLFAIAQELKARGVRSGSPVATGITLLVGLPPAHYGAQYKAFTQYFLNRGPLTITLDGYQYRIRIDECYCYVQAFAAMMTAYGEIRKLSDAIVLDIGGFTADYLPVTAGVPSVSDCGSLDYGVIKLYNKIISRVNSEYDMLLTEDKVDAVLLDHQYDLPDEIVSMIDHTAAEYIDSLVSQMRERDIDLRSTSGVFCGGGAMLLDNYIRSNPRIGRNALVINDVKANVYGYELLYKQSHPAMV